MTAPPWVDDVFPFPTPAPFALVMDLAWQKATREGYYDLCEFGTTFLMFDFAEAPAPPEGWECSPEFERQSRTVTFLAPPEFVPFGARGDGSYYGWLMPTPELAWAGRWGDEWILPDHPVVLADGHQNGIFPLGPGTRDGLRAILSRTLANLRRWEVGDQAEFWTTNAPRYREQVRELAEVLGVVPDPDEAEWKPGQAPVRTVPPGWRYAPTNDGVGVLAPADAFAGDTPVMPEVWENPVGFDQAMTEADRLIDAGSPATALVLLKDVFDEASVCYFPRLKPTWARAYQALNRPQLVERLDLMAAKGMYQDSICYCRVPHLPA